MLKYTRSNLIENKYINLVLACEILYRDAGVVERSDRDPEGNEVPSTERRVQKLVVHLNP